MAVNPLGIMAAPLLSPPRSVLPFFGLLYHLHLHVLCGGVHAQQPPMFAFTSSSYSVSVYENSAARTYAQSSMRMGVVLNLALGWKVRYFIEAGDSEGIFQAESMELGDFSFLRVRTNGGSGGTLNREVQDNYTLMVRATTQGGLEAFATVYINILDMNDLRPLFSPTSYSFVVPEGAPLGSSVGQVTATDADIGSNGEFYYFFRERVELFSVHPTSGVVTLTGQPIPGQRIELEVRAVDRGMKLYGTNGVSSTAKVVLTVEQVNEFAPVLSAVGLVPSWLDGDPVFAVVTVEDQDEGISGDVEWVSIVEGDPLELFKVDRSVGNTFTVKRSVVVDWEKFPFGCNLTLQARDRGTPPLFSNTQVVQILVKKPEPVQVRFKKQLYQVRLSEIAPPGSIVVEVQITPKPLSVTYSFRLFSAPPHFLINPLTGVIVTTTTLTSLSQEVVELEVIEEGSKVNTRVQVTVEDANDNTPTFTRSAYDVSVDETTPVGTVILVVSAVDDDRGENGCITHSLAGLQALPFTIDQDSGEVLVAPAVLFLALRTTSELDYETLADLFTFSVRASDWGSPYRRENEVNVTVRVVNVNDNRPLFERVSCRGMIGRDFPVGQNIVTMSAVDIDDLGLVKYRILSGNELDYFNLNPDSGVLFLRRSLASANLKTGVFNLKVEATDGELRSEPTYVNVTVVRGRMPSRSLTCQDTGVAQRMAEMLLRKAAMVGRPRLDEGYRDMFSVNRQTPEFDLFPSSIVVMEDLAVGATVFQVRATDDDTAFNGLILYGISDGNRDSCFSIAMETGLITVFRPLDRERSDRYVLNVTIYDQGLPQRSNWRLLTVNVEDANDNDPKFSQDSYSVVVPEDTALGVELVRVEATDGDQGSNGEVFYTLLTALPEFSINSQTGSVVVTGQLDRETVPAFVLKVEARDKAERGTQRFSVTTLTITLEDVNDCPPLVVSSSYSARVLEDLPPGAVIAWIQTQDPDLGLGGQVSYTLTNDVNGAFEVDSVSGAVRVGKDLDYERQQIYNLTIVAKDRGTPSLRSLSYLDIEVVDVDENAFAPYFSDFALRAIVKENSRVGTSVLVVSAGDEDRGKDGIVRYSLRGGSGLGSFSIDEETGLIYTTGILDCETKDSYWLTVYATDRGLTPLSASMEVFIQVEDVNDHSPLTSDPIYHPVVMENSPKDLSVIRIQAQDPDFTATSGSLRYRITAGNPQNFFSINSKTGLITTTSRKLDREQQAEHFLEITVMDSPVASRLSTIWLIVHVQDQNDNAPTFPEPIYRIRLPERDRNKRGEPVYRVFAFDRDVDANGNITYSIVEGNEDEKFSIDPLTAMVSSRKMVTAGSYDILTIKAVDGGSPPLWSTAKLHIVWVRKPVPSPLPLVFSQRYYNFSISEATAVGQPVGLVSVRQTNTPVWFDIVGGRSAREMFYIPQYICGGNCSSETESLDSGFDLQQGLGTVVIAKPLDAEGQSLYNMMVMVTDGTNTATTQVFIRVLDSNDNAPVFSQPTYDIAVSEDTPADTELLRVRASDRDERARLSFSIHGSVDPASMRLFRINPGTGVVYTADRLDYEARTQHILTIMVKDQEFPFHRDLCRVLLAVEDSNDNVPFFSRTTYEAVAYESSPPGTPVLQVSALDRDKGPNGLLKYSIEAGNTGGVFSIDADTGLISVATDLDLSTVGYYIITVRVTDSGTPPLSATATARVSLTLSDSSQPKFSQTDYQAEVMENSASGTLVVSVYAVSRSALVYDIITGNNERHFTINSYTGVITTCRPLDFESTGSYSLLVHVLSMAGVEASATVSVQVGDQNDNPPVFHQLRYVGIISEASPVNSVVLGEDGNPLVIQASDRDQNLNALLVFNIIDDMARTFFTVDSGTGSIRTISALDYETFPVFSFRVNVRDSGMPQKTADSPAHVLIKVVNINDSPPKFSQDSYETVLLLPSYPGVEVLRVTAYDPDLTPDPSIDPATTPADLSVTPALVYTMVDRNLEHFSMERYTGVIAVKDHNLSKDRYRFNIKVWDGRFSGTALVTILVREVMDSGLLFSLPFYSSSVTENDGNISIVTVVNAVGHRLNEPLKYTLLNANGRFTIRPTAGVVLTTGAPLDREEQASYSLVVEASREHDRLRVARVTVKVQVEDVNDNAPEFIGLPYYAAVQVESEPGFVVFRVSAVDRDSGRNGDVIYILKEEHRNFQMDLLSGELILQRSLEADLSKAEYKLTIVAQDGGLPPLSSEVELTVAIINKAMPVFDKPFYGVTVREDVPLSTSLLCLNATSPQGQAVLYTVMDEDSSPQFDIGFDTGVIRIVDPLDYEKASYYRLTVKATDTQTGARSEVDVEIAVLDVNDNPPMFQNVTYSASLPENSMIGTAVLQVSALDVDSESNSLVRYQILSDVYNSTDYFHIDSSSGLVLTARMLDYETTQQYKFFVRATDSGEPPLSSDVSVMVTVTDTNDNPPSFSQSLYDVFVSELAPRGQFVTSVQASDADSCDANRLRYSILSGDERMMYAMDPETGMISLSNQRRQGTRSSYRLNVSVSDGVFTNTAQVSVRVLGANLYSPVFSQRFYLAEVRENALVGSRVIQVHATDEDSGLFGQVTFTFINDLGKTQFSIDANGVITTTQKLDRENPSYKDIVLTVMALDGGGRAAFCTVRVVLTDENDNAPRFRAVEYRMSIKSNVPKGSLVTQIQAADPDAGANGRITYSLYSEARLPLVDVLEVEPDSGWMVTKGSVVHLQGTVLSFFVKATDGGSPAKHSLVSAFIHVLSPEALVPSFTQPQYSFTIPEDTAVGTALGNVYLAPGQTGVYSAVGGETPDSNQGGTFLVDRETGLIRLTKPLDYEAVSIYRFKVSATTRRDLIESISTVDVEVKILDINDNRPLFETTSYVAMVMEGMPVGTRVVQVRALDPDWGSNGQVTYRLGPPLNQILANRPGRKSSSSSPSISGTSTGPSSSTGTRAMFSIDSKTGWITTLSVLDHETIPSYTFVVLAYDRGEQLQLTSTTVITVTVADVNDNPPRFERDFYRGAVKENDPPGQVVSVLSTKDKDTSDHNKLVSYHITGGNPGGVFRISLIQDEWRVVVCGQLDREQKDFFLLNITASDGLYVTSTAVEVTVMDANDNTPICNQAVYSVSIPEDVPPNHGVLTVGATDKDTGPSAEIQYSLFGIGVEDFYMDANTGDVKTATVMDREKTSNYKLVAQATDGGGRFCRSEVSVTLLDVNDNPPSFVLSQYLAQVYEDAAPKALLTRIQAKDPDEGTNRTVVYSLVDSAGGVFSIDPVSGVVVLERALDREAQDSYRVRVQASDRSGLPGALSSQVDLIIAVLDVNDNPPVFQRQDYTISVPEDVAMGTEILRVSATSDDIGANAYITYSIRAGNKLGKFQIDKTVGSISVVDDLDFEACKDFFLTVEALDGGEPPLSSTTMVTIELMDVNDNAPSFSQDTYNVLVSEDAAVGQTITRLLAEDLDSQVNGRITYSILRGDRGNQFWIDPVTGLLKVNKRLDREEISRYTLSIQAFDSGSPAMSSTVIVNIDISDVNDNPPVFAPPNATATVQLNQPAGSSLLKLSVSDGDSPLNGAPFEFRIMSGNEGDTFSVDPTGDLRSNRVLGPDISREFTLEVQARDSGKPRLSSSCWVFIRVVGDSQYRPTVTPLEIYIVTATHSYPGGLIGRIYASDRDVTDVLSFTQMPLQQWSPFKINRQDGSIMAMAGLEPGRYQCNATVSDGRYSVPVVVTVRVEQVTEDLLRNTVILRFPSVTPEDLLGRHLNSIKQGLHAVVGWGSSSPGQQQDPLHMLGVDQVSEGVDLLLAMERPEGGGGGGGYLTPQDLTQRLQEARMRGEGKIEGRESPRREQKESVLAGAEVLGLACSGELVCVDSMCEQALVVEGGAMITYSTPTVSLVAPRYSRSETCTCPGGSCPSPVEERCEGQACPVDMQCVRSGPIAPSVCQCLPDRMDQCAGPTSLSFSGNSYIKYRVSDGGAGGEMRLSLRIRTLQSRGVIMYTRANPCTMLKIEGGRLWFQLDCDNTLGIMGISGRPVNDGRWHAVTLELTSNYTLLSLDDSYVERRRAVGAPVRLWPLTPDPSFFFGAQVRPPTSNPGDRGQGRAQGPVLGAGQGGRGVRVPPQAQDGFQGCLSSLVLNRNELPLQNKRSRYAEIAGLSEVKLGCVLFLDPCVTLPCLNGATCNSLPSGGFWCSCGAGYTGGRCEEELTKCLPNPCQNGAQCAPVDGSFLCGCPPGLTGLICDEDVDECEENDGCENRGLCVNTFGEYFCNCSYGYEGQFCGERSLLDSDLEAELLSYVGPVEIIGIGVLIFVISLLLILFIIFRKKIRFQRKDSPPTLGQDGGGGKEGVAVSVAGTRLGVSAVSVETSYMLKKTGIGSEGIEFKAVRVAAESRSPTNVGGGVGSYGNGAESIGGDMVTGGGGEGAGPPQVMVRPTKHPATMLPGWHGNNKLVTRGGDEDKMASSESSLSQMSSFLSSESSHHILGGASRKGVAVCSVVPNLQPPSPCHSEMSPTHKAPWERQEVRGEERGRYGRERGEERGRYGIVRNEERERYGRQEEWEQRAFELERTQRDGSPLAGDLVEEVTCFSDSTSVTHSSFTSDSFDDNASIVTVIRLVNDTVESLENEANRHQCNKDNTCVEFIREYLVDSYQWESSDWLSPSQLRLPGMEGGSHYDITGNLPPFSRAGSVRSLQLDNRLGGCRGDWGHNGDQRSHSSLSVERRGRGSVEERWRGVPRERGMDGDRGMERPRGRGLGRERTGGCEGMIGHRLYGSAERVQRDQSEESRANKFRQERSWERPGKRSWEHPGEFLGVHSWDRRGVGGIRNRSKEGGGRGCGAERAPMADVRLGVPGGTGYGIDRVLAGERSTMVRRRAHSSERDNDQQQASSPVYEEFCHPEPDPSPDQDVYDTLPPTRLAHQGYPSPPPGLNLHPTQLLPPLRAWDGQSASANRETPAEVTGQGSRLERSESGDELERLLNLVSLRARRATRTQRPSDPPPKPPPEPSTGWDGLY
ncbi:protocadherin Fat 3 [Esox lucius]|uniref:protocadherin Fat 3 n=1 Tax=Esox lucius TaxID=8010 RepID=UPI001476BEE1|nr:protocadherin Fat 3 [Esox lucius]